MSVGGCPVGEKERAEEAGCAALRAPCLPQFGAAAPGARVRRFDFGERQSGGRETGREPERERERESDRGRDAVGCWRLVGWAKESLPSCWACATDNRRRLAN